jgi:hypothetical protein
MALQPRRQPSSIYEYYQWFKNGGTSMDDDEQCGLPSTLRTKNLIAHVKEVICENCRLTVQEVAEEVAASSSPCHTTLTEA